MKLTIESAKVYKLRGEGNDYTWAIIIIRSWQGGGSIDVQSDYGNYAYIWASIGDQDIRKFLLNLGYDYFMGKAHHTRGYATDWGKTVDRIKRMVCEERRSNDLEAEEAREIFDDVDTLDRDEGFFWQAREHAHLYNFLSRHEWPKQVERDGNCAGFWERIWPEIRSVWMKELSDENLS